MKRLIPVLYFILLATVLFLESSASAQNLGKNVGDNVMDFSLEDQRGKTQVFSKLRGNKPSLLYFYSGCCGHCTNQLPLFIPMARKMEEKGIKVVGVQYFGNSETCKAKIEKFNLAGTILADTDGEVCGKFGVGDFTVMTTDKDGVIRFRGNPNDISQIENSIRPKD